ncbi:hypothetical protein TW84_11065 [Vibrio neptunius]|uniref:hypothetical protein n=1 Tax=Vibrio neptunius TaxID=170651 RepID=UPI0005FA6AB9|nr:hypothetical protein [Vibrio neptunius]KJY89893.1 hypothetical protein TW84_11065 [Vibrio neptunius]
MDVPVDSLPELTPEYRQAQLQAVQDAKVVYQFEEVIVPATDYGTISIWSLFGLFSLWMMWIAVQDGLWAGVLLVILFSGGFLTYCYFAGNPDTQQKVTLTEKGIIVTELTLVPDACFAALRYSGYAGIAISLIGVVLVGPMMFVGAGAGLLMSFKMAGVVNRPRQRVRPFAPNASYSIYIVPEGRYKHGLIESQLLPKIEKAVDSEENKAIYRENRIFYSFCCIASPEVQEQFLKHLKQLVTLTEEE